MKIMLAFCDFQSEFAHIHTVLSLNILISKQAGQRPPMHSDFPLLSNSGNMVQLPDFSVLLFPHLKAEHNRVLPRVPLRPEH